MFTIEDAIARGDKEIEEVDTENREVAARAYGFFKGREIQPDELVFYLNAKTGVLKKHALFHDKLVIITRPFGKHVFVDEPKTITKNGQIRIFLRAE